MNNPILVVEYTTTSSSSSPPSTSSSSSDMIPHHHHHHQHDLINRKASSFLTSNRYHPYSSSSSYGTGNQVSVGGQHQIPSFYEQDYSSTYTSANGYYDDYDLRYQQQHHLLQSQQQLVDYSGMINVSEGQQGYYGTRGSYYNQPDGVVEFSVANSGQYASFQSRVNAESNNMINNSSSSLASSPLSSSNSSIRIEENKASSTNSRPILSVKKKTKKSQEGENSSQNNKSFSSTSFSSMSGNEENKKSKKLKKELKGKIDKNNKSSPSSSSSSTSSLSLSSSNQTESVGNSNQAALGFPGEPKKRVSANKKERRRTQSINNAFADLRNRIPEIPGDTKLSKIKTLKLATDYIEHLMKQLEDNDSNALMQPFKPDLGKLRRESRMKEIKVSGSKVSPLFVVYFSLNFICVFLKEEVERKAKGRTGWPSEVWSIELKKKLNENNGHQHQQHHKLKPNVNTNMNKQNKLAMNSVIGGSGGTLLHGLVSNIASSTALHTASNHQKLVTFSTSDLSTYPI